MLIYKFDENVKYLRLFVLNLNQNKQYQFVQKLVLHKKSSFLLIFTSILKKSSEIFYFDLSKVPTKFNFEPPSK